MRMTNNIIWKIISIDEFDNIILVNPPIANSIIKPKDHWTEIFNFNFAPW